MIQESSHELNKQVAGWISIHRQIENNFLHPLQEDRKFTKYEAWLDLLGMAYFKDYKKLIQGKLITIKRGSVDITRMQLAKRWKWDRETVERFLKLIESDNMITISKVNKNATKSATILKINNYNDYQPNFYCNAAINTAIDAAPYNKYNNKDKNILSLALKPTIEEIKIYCLERKNNIDPEKFFDFYEAKGWMVGLNKMKDWKAAVRTWERNGNTKGIREGNDDDEYSPV